VEQLKTIVDVMDGSFRKVDRASKPKDGVRHVGCLHATDFIQMPMSLA
jgi:hypothetical protein